MIEKALKGSPRYFAALMVFLAVMGIGGGFYLVQLNKGLMITGLSRDVSWGFYIAQFTYMVGVAASAVMLVLPYYFHHYKAYSKMIIMGEFLAIAAVIMCLGFIVIDIGQPQRMLNVLIYSTPGSVLFWDMVVLNGYLLLNVHICGYLLYTRYQGKRPSKWFYIPFVFTAIVWAVSIHTVTAFLYAGLPGRHFWLTAILAARFLASAFCSGPAILLLASMAVKRFSGFDVGREATGSLVKIITYAMIANVFFFFLEVFTAAYSNIPGHQHALEFLFFGHHGHVSYVTYFMWVAAFLAIFSLVRLVVPAWRENDRMLPWTLGFLVLATYIDKGLGLIIGGFTPNPFDGLTIYAPTGMELLITLAIWAMGAMVVTLLYKVAVTVKYESNHA